MAGEGPRESAQLDVLGMTVWGPSRVRATHDDSSSSKRKGSPLALNERSLQPVGPGNTGERVPRIRMSSQMLGNSEPLVE